MIGEITRLDIDRGFGFIKCREESSDVFFHVKQLVGLTFDSSLYGKRVEFAIEQGERGPRATAVRALEH
jgi:cold shock protein